MRATKAGDLRLNKAKKHLFDGPINSTGFDILSISALWLVSLFIINPLGDFPLNDDWSYALTVKHFLETGDFLPIGWTSTPLLTHVLWGSFFCLLKGYSFETLRFSTLTLSLVGVLATYLLVRVLDRSRWLAVIAALTVAFNPIYYALSTTFMTDVPFTAVMIVATLFLTRCLNQHSNFDLWLGTLLMMIATLNRQLGITIPLAFTVTFILKNGFTRQSIGRALLPSVMTLGALLALQQWLAATDRLPALYSAKTDAMMSALESPELWVDAAGQIFVVLLYLGWFLLPVLVLCFGRIWLGTKGKKTSRLRLLAMALLCFILLSIIPWHRGLYLMPLGGNIIIESGIGPLTLHDTLIMQANHVPVLSSGFWFAITVFSLLGGTLLVIAGGIFALRTFRTLWSNELDSNHATSLFLILSALLYLLPLIIAGLFDRYLLPPIPLLAAAFVNLTTKEARPTALSKEGRLFSVVSVILLGLLFVYAIGGTRDYLTWNRTRWAMIDDFMRSEHVTVEEIDGGFEFMGCICIVPIINVRRARAGGGSKRIPLLLRLAWCPAIRSYVKIAISSGFHHIAALSLC